MFSTKLEKSFFGKLTNTSRIYTKDIVIMKTATVSLFYAIKWRDNDTYNNTSK